MEGEKKYTIQQYLKGKVADYTISDNVVESVLFERGFAPSVPASDVDERTRKLCYADLLKYIYLQPTTSKSYSVANGNWNQKEGSTSMTENDRRRLLRTIRRIYGEYGEPLDLPVEAPTIRMVSRGMRPWGGMNRR